MLKPLIDEHKGSECPVNVSVKGGNYLVNGDLILKNWFQARHLHKIQV